MPLYRYKARNENGDLLTGTVEAPSRDAAGAKLDQDGLLPVFLQPELIPSGGPMGGDIMAARVTSEDMVMFTFQLSTLINAGVPLLTGLRTLAKQIQNKKLQSIMEQAVVDIESGSTLSESLAKHPKVFPSIYSNMIRAGEASGQLGEIFLRLGEMSEHEAETREKVQAALRYPKIVVGALVLAFLIIMKVVVPRFVKIFEKFNLELPLPTKILMGLNSVFVDYWIPMVIIIVLAFGLTRWWISTPQGRYYWHLLQITMPILGPLNQKAALSRFANMMGTLIQSGLPIIENLQITATAIGNDVISEGINDIRESVQEGRGLSEPMGQSKYFTPLVVQMVAIGESTGELDEILHKISRYYDLEVDYTTKRLGSYIEPILTLALGIMVLFFALAIFLPMWDMTKIAGAGG